MEMVEALSLVCGRGEEEILLRNEYLAAENEILKSKLQRPPRLNNNQKIRLAKIGKRIGLKALKEIACIVKPETILEWFRKLVARASPKRYYLFISIDCDAFLFGFLLFL